MRGRRTRAGALALLLALAALPLLAGCGGSDFSDFTGDLKFGDEQVADTQVTDVMQVPNGGLGSSSATPRSSGCVAVRGADAPARRTRHAN